MKTEEKLTLLRNFKEDQLIANVIIPLLEKMGFRNITKTHGTLEKGKDLLFYQENVFEEREYTGIQVKAVNIHGSAGKDGNAGEILTQAQQAFTHEFRDIYDNKSKHIDKFIIITSGDVTETAKESIEGQLKSFGYYKLINFFDGNKIVSLVDKYMPDFFWEEYDCFNRYFQAMQRDFATIADISAIGQKEAINLEEIYVSLKLSESIKGREFPGEYENDKIFDGKIELDKKARKQHLIKERVLEPEKAVQQFHRLVILGAPGAGKTTLLKHLALKTCKENLEKQERIVIPIPIILREFLLEDKPIREYIDLIFEKYGFPGAKKFAEKELKAGKCILLLDGFDELAAKENQEKVTKEIHAFAKNYMECKILVTSRPAGYHDELTGFTRLEVMDFDDTQIKGFIQRWFGETSVNKAKSMQKAVLENENIKTLARNPLLVSIIAVIYEEDRELPERRAELYKRAIEVLLSRWDKRKKLANRYTSDQKEFILKKLAFTSHCCNRRVLKEQDILIEIRKHLSRLGLQETDTQPILEEIWQRSFLLKQIAAETYDFLHLSFQEYFTALELKALPNGMDIIIENIDKQWWEEPILLYAGISKDAGPLIEKTKGKVPEDIFYSNLFLAGKCIADADFTEPELKEEIAQQLWWLYREGEFFLIRERAMDVLRRMKPSCIIDTLSKELKDENAEIRRRAASTLGDIGSIEALEPLIQALSLDKDYDVRRISAEALGTIGSNEALEPLIQALTSDKNSEVRRSAAYALGTIGSSEAIGLLTQALRLDKNSDVRWSAAYALGKIESIEALEPLTQVLSSNKDGRFRGVVAALGKIGRSEALEPLIRTLASDKNSNVRRLAASALGTIGNIEALEPLIQVLSSDKDSNVRQSSAEALGTIGSIEALAPLIQALSSDKDSDVRQSVAEALGTIGSNKAIEPLLNALASDKDGRVRGSAAEALGVIGDDTEIQPLVKALGDDEEINDSLYYYGDTIWFRVKDKVFEALDKICRRTGKRLTWEDVKQLKGDSKKTHKQTKRKRPVIDKK